MRKKIRVGKATDGLMGGKSKKPRHYLEIDDSDGESIVAKVMTHDVRNEMHVKKLNHNMRKPIRNFSKNSVVDKTLYVEKVNKKPIRTSELNFEKSNFEFDELQSRKIRRFIFSSDKNRQRYFYWKTRHKKKK